MDVVIHLERQTLDYLLDLKRILDDRFDCDVDLVLFRDSIRPILKNRLIREAAYAE